MSGASTYISTEAGGPATNTRLTRSGRLILRFAESTIVRPCAPLCAHTGRASNPAPNSASAERREQSAVGLEVDQRRAVEAIEAAHQQHRSLDLHQLDDRSADGIGTHRRAQREDAAGVAVAFRGLQGEIAPRLVQPVEHF
jgi:hypothetical protein